MREMNDNVITELASVDFCELTSQEMQQDNFRRMFQMLDLIYKNQVEIKQLLVANKIY